MSDVTDTDLQNEALKRVIGMASIYLSSCPDRYGRAAAAINTVMDLLERRRAGSAPTPQMEICPNCQGTGTAGHPDSGATCDCDGGMTPVPQDQQAEAVRAHIQKMQSYVREYLEPGPYVAKHGKGGMFNEPHPHQDEAHAYFMRQQMREAVLNDLIYMLDGPEERAALAHPAPQAEAAPCPACDGSGDASDKGRIEACCPCKGTGKAPSRDEALRDAELERAAQIADEEAKRHLWDARHAGHSQQQRAKASACWSAADMVAQRIRALRRAPTEDR